MAETLPAAIQRMRSQGFSDKQIAGQVARWHPDWGRAVVLAKLHAHTDARQASASAPERGYIARTTANPFATGAPVKPLHYTPSRNSIDLGPPISRAYHWAVNRYNSGVAADNAAYGRDQSHGSLGFLSMKSVEQAHGMKPHDIALKGLPGKNTIGRSLNDVADSATYIPSGLYQLGKNPTGTLKAMGKGFYNDFTNPRVFTKYPDRPIMDLLGLASAGVGTAGRIGEAARVASAGEGGAAVARALVRSKPAGMREIQYGGKKTLALNSRAPLSRIAQRGIDSLMGVNKGGRFSTEAGVERGGMFLAPARHRFNYQDRVNTHRINAVTDAGKTVAELPPARQPGKVNPVLAVARPFNRASRAAVLYGKLGFGPTNLAGQEWLSAVHQLLASPLRRAQNAALTSRFNPNGLKGVGLDRYRAAAGVGEVKGSALSDIESRMQRGNPLRKVEHGIGTLDSAMGNAYGRILDTPYRGAAFLHEMKRQGLGDKAQIERGLSLLARHGENVRAGHVRGDFGLPTAPEARKTLEASRRSNDAMINYDTLGKTGRAFSDAIFFMPWLKGSALYGGHFLRDHPAQAAAWAQLGQQGKQKAGLGKVASFAEGMFKTGERNVPGLGRVPLAVNPTSASILTQPVQIGQTLAGMAGLTPNKPGIDPEGYLSPAVYALVAALTHRDPFTQRQIPQNESALTIWKNQFLNSIPAYNDFYKGGVYRQLTGKGPKPNSANPTRTLFPRTPSDRAWQFALGGLGRTPVNPVEMQSRYRAEQTAGASKEGAARLRGGWYQADLLQRLNKMRASQGNPPLASLPAPLALAVKQNTQLQLEQLQVAKMSPNAVTRHGSLTAMGGLAARWRAYAGTQGIPQAKIDKVTNVILSVKPTDYAKIKALQNTFSFLGPPTVSGISLVQLTKLLNQAAAKRYPYANGGAPISKPGR